MWIERFCTPGSWFSMLIDNFSKIPKRGLRFRWIIWNDWQWSIWWPKAARSLANVKNGFFEIAFNLGEGQVICFSDHPGVYSSIPWGKPRSVPCMCHRSWSWTECRLVRAISSTHCWDSVPIGIRQLFSIPFVSYCVTPRLSPNTITILYLRNCENWNKRHTLQPVPSVQMIEWTNEYI